MDTIYIVLIPIFSLVVIILSLRGRYRAVLSRDKTIMEILMEDMYPGDNTLVFYTKNGTQLSGNDFYSPRNYNRKKLVAYVSSNRNHVYIYDALGKCLSIYPNTTEDISGYDIVEHRIITTK